MSEVQEAKAEPLPLAGRPHPTSTPDEEPPEPGTPFVQTHLSTMMSYPFTQTGQLGRHTVLSIVYAGILLGVLGCAFYFLQPDRNPAAIFAVCTSVSCKGYVSLLNESMNETVDPCSDFHEYVCSGWNRLHPNISVYQNHTSTFQDFVLKTLRMATVAAKHQTPFQKAARFFSTCYATALSEQGEMTEFKSILMGFNIRWPDMYNKEDVFTLMIKVHNTLWLDTLLNIHMSDIGGGPIISILPSRTLSAIKSKRESLIAAGEYRKYIEEFSRFFSEGKGTTQATFETLDKIENATLEALTGHGILRNVCYCTVEELSSFTAKVSHVRWAFLLANGLDTSIRTVMYVFVSNTEYLQAFDALMTTVGEANLYWYVGWLTVEQLAPFIGLPSAALVFRGYNAALRAMPFKCLALTELLFGWAIFNRYTIQALNSDVRQDIEMISKHVKLAYARDIRKKISPGGLSIFESVHVKLHGRALMEEPHRMNIVFSEVKDMGNLFSSNWVRVVKAYSRVPQNVFLEAHARFIKKTENLSSYGFRKSDGNHILMPPYVATLPLYDFELPPAVKLGGIGTVIAESMYRQLYPDTEIQELPEGIAGVTDCSKASNAGSSDVAARLTALDILFSILRGNAMVAGWRLEGLQLTEQQLLLISACYTVCGSENAEALCNEPMRSMPGFFEAFACKVDLSGKVEECARHR